MFGIGIPELILILIVGLIVFGPGKLPEVGRAVGKGLREFRKASSAFQAVMNEPDPPPQKPQQAPQTQPAPVQQTTAAAADAGHAQAAAAEPATEPAPAKTVQEPAAPAEPVYTAPTQESVRQQLEAQKKEVV